MNRVELTATLRSRDVVRYSPAGIAMVDCVLAHRSELCEAGRLRWVELEVPGIAFEGVAHRLADSPLDATARFSGFLANRSRRSRRPVLHITQFELIASRIRED